MENQIIMSPNKESLADLKSAFSCLGWEMLSSSYERNSGTQHWEIYVSIKKGKRAVRFNVWKNGKRILINGIASSILHRTNTEVILDVNVFDDHYSKMDEKHKAMTEGKKGFAFKKQLLIPYVQGSLEENGVRKVNVTDAGKKQFKVSGEMNFGSEKRTISIESVPAKYAELVDIEFDDYQFDVYTKYFSGRLKFSEIIIMLNNFKTVKDELDIKYEPTVKQMKEKQTEINIAHNALSKLKDEMGNIKATLNKYDLEFSESLRKIINGAQAKK